MKVSEFYKKLEEMECKIIIEPDKHYILYKDKKIFIDIEVEPPKDFNNPQDFNIVMVSLLYSNKIIKYIRTTLSISIENNNFMENIEYFIKSITKYKD